MSAPANMKNITSSLILFASAISPLCRTQTAPETQIMDSAMPDKPMRAFDHVGVPTTDRQVGEMYVEATKVWVTDPALHPHRIEYLRFEPDTPVKGPVRDLPHVAFRVQRLEQELEGAEVLLGPFQATDTLRVVFVLKDGAVFEFMENSAAGHWFRQSGE